MINDAKFKAQTELIVKIESDIDSIKKSIGALNRSMHTKSLATNLTLGAIERASINLYYANLDLNNAIRIERDKNS